MSYRDIELKGTMYKDAHDEGKSFTQLLEEKDPTEAYEKGSALSKMDAFERQLMKEGIRTNGSKSDYAAKFYQTNSSSILFPGFVDRRVREGIEEGNILNKIVATTTNIDSSTYKSIHIDEEELEEKTSLADIAEGAEIPETEIKLRDQITKVYKRGRTLKMTYEALKEMKIDMLSLHLKRIGIQIGKQQMYDALSTIINGDAKDDANKNAAEIITVDKLDYEELVKFFMEFKEFYDVNTALAPKEVLTQILLMDEFKDPNAGFNYQKTGEMVNPIGADWNRVDRMDEGQIIALDNRMALEQVVVNETLIEYDKLINRQINRAVISERKGFNVIDGNAAKVLQVKKGK